MHRTAAPSRETNPALIELAAALERVAGAIDAGRLDEIAPLAVGGDEAGYADVVAAADQLIATVRRAYALEAAVHELFEALSSHLRLDYLGYEALYRVAEHTGASGGAVVLVGEGAPDVVATLDFDAAPAVVALLAAQAAAAPHPVQLTVVPGDAPVAAVSFAGDTGVLGVVLLAGVRLDDGISRLLALLARALGFAVSNAIAHAAVESRAATDALTGCYNRSAGWAALEQAVRVAAHGGPQVGVLMLDLDHFKTVNDVHGHQGGDEVLRAAGRAIASGLRDGDLVMRYGGEEFAVAVAGADAATLLALAERVHARIGALSVVVAGRSIPVTVSVGVASWAPCDSAETLVGRADRALYAAKAAGRDRVVCAPDG